MNLLLFELKKTLKQKKYVWMFLIVLLITTAVFSANSYQRSRLQGRWAQYTAVDEIRPLVREWSSLQTELVRTRDQQGLTYEQEKQLEYSRDIGSSLQRIGTIVHYGMGGHYNNYYQRFLDSLEGFTHYGGEFTALDGVDREIAIALQKWRVEHDLGYEFESHPVSQHLFMKQITSILLSIIGVAILIIFFGNTITEEKEKHTWKTIKTQPISKLKLIISKHFISILMILAFTIMVLGVGLVIPLLRGGWTLNLQHPQVLTTEDSFNIISTGEYIFLSSILFLCVSSIFISITILLSKWIKKSFNLFFIVGAILVAGYFTVSSIQSPFNPFYLLKFQEILNEVSQNTPWLYIISAGIWSIFFLVLTILLPEPEFRVDESKNDKVPFISGKTKVNETVLTNILSFEWRKVRREGLLKVLSIIILIIIVGGHFFLTDMTQSREDEYLAELDYRVIASQESYLNYESRIQEFTEQKRELEDSGRLTGERLNPADQDLLMLERRINYLERLLAIEEEYIVKLKAAIVAYDEEDWQTFYDYQLFVNQKAFDLTYPDGTHQGARETLRRFTKLVSMEEKHWLMERDIRPIPSGEFISTIHEFWGVSTRTGWRGEMVRQEQWAWENRKVDNSGLYYLYITFTNYLYFIPLALIMFLIGGGMAREKGKKPTINLLKTQPLPLEKIYIAKVVNSFSIMLVTTFVICIIVVLVGTVLNRFGDWEYPILHYISYREVISPHYTGLTAGGQGYYFMTLGQFIVHSTLLFLAISLFAISISTFISLFIKKSFVVLSMTLLILLGGYWLNGKNPLQISHMSPFSYFNIPEIVNGEMAARLNNPMFSVKVGVIILLTLSIAIIILGYWLINKKSFMKSHAKNSGRTLGGVK